MSDLVPLTKVYIIESPFTDILENRKEGVALSSILSLARIDNEVFSVSDMYTLKLAFQKIAENVLQAKGQLGMVQIHFPYMGLEMV